MREKISACIICYNEESKIRRCLESVAWCDEIVVVDSFSTDRTVELCREFTDVIHQREWLGYIGQRNYIRDIASNPWVLFIDADEAVSADLRVEIISEFEKGPSTFDGYQFPRQVLYLGKWITRGLWYPDMKLRLFRKDRGVSRGREPHDHVEVDGPVKTLDSPIFHYTYDSIHDHLRQMNRFSTITAQEKYAEGLRFSWWDFLGRPIWRFFRGYILRGGFLLGWRGLVIAKISSFEVCLKYAKLWELELREKGECGPGATKDAPEGPRAGVR